MSTTVLIVEDHPVNRDIIGRRLSKRGYTIRYAVDGPSGVEGAVEFNPDIILMDIGLGEMDGCEATRRIKANPATTNIPIIALTASAFETDRTRALEAGCIDFDTKPVDLPRLLIKMNRALLVQ
ncbi:response regulator [Ahrensia kielensis]|jgi:two-component system, cell cycle response regulator DivK|uniref:response regulator n=1 Tax=Ahrensia kielensis TaxID=76980 RepID=UPI0003AAF454|nr:response regulator [Ahrensia kielensis]